MKLPFELGLRFFLRFVVPGFIIAASTSYQVSTALDSMSFIIDKSIVFTAIMVFSAWIINISDMHIYMIFEGRRFWPRFLSEHFFRKERRRLAGLMKIVRNTSPLRETYRRSSAGLKRRLLRLHREASVELRAFPMNGEGRYYAEFPTRLGNAIASYEKHSERLYGMDSAFYWHRLWLVIEKDARDEIDGAQSMVDGAVYASFAFYFSSFFWFASFILNIFGVGENKSIDMSVVFLMISVAALGLAYSLYRISIRAHLVYGELFKAMFDIFQSRIELSSIRSEIKSAKNGDSISYEDRVEENRALWRYLHNFRIIPHSGAVRRPVIVSKWNKRRHK